MKNWGIYILVALGIVVYKTSSQANRDGTGAIVGEGTVDAFTLRVGDCFDDTSSLFGGGGEEVSSLPGVPCSEPHDNEVFAVFDVAIDTFPEGDAMANLAFDSCLARFESFVGTNYDSSSLDIMTLYPSYESWSRQNDREVVCAVYDIESTKLVGTVKGRAL